MDTKVFMVKEHYLLRISAVVHIYTMGIYTANIVANCYWKRV